MNGRVAACSGLYNRVRTGCIDRVKQAYTDNNVHWDANLGWAELNETAELLQGVKDSVLKSNIKQVLAGCKEELVGAKIECTKMVEIAVEAELQGNATNTSSSRA